MILKAVERKTGFTRETFKPFLEKRVPIIFTDLIAPWPATKKWTPDFFKENYGDLKVPVYSSNYSKPGKTYMVADKTMELKDFIETMEQGPTDLRMFLFNIFKHAPELCKDYQSLDIMPGFISSFPFMFFGGEGSKVALHYDIDLSHVFLNQIHGRKRVVLFAPEQTTNIYRHPYTVASYIDVNNPDYEKHPALKKVTGYECMLEPGETLFMPSGYWHYIEYTDFGYSISLRANESMTRRAKGLYKIATHFLVDKGMNKIMGQRWRKIKADMAKKRAEKGELV
nr:cupin-like domain-containing protein [Saprospiraceae bacterium]